MNRLQRTASAVGLLALAVFTVQACRKALREHGDDLTCYLDAGAAALRGETPYDHAAYFEYLYSPCFALAMGPLSLLPVAVAAVLWALASGLALFCTVRVVRGLALGAQGRPFDGRDVVAVVALAAIGFRIVQANFANGQVNLIVLGMAAAAVSALQRGRDRTAAMWLTLAVQAKTVPILLLGMLLVRGRWRAIAWTAAFGAVTSALPLVAWGADTVDVYRQWFEMIDYKLRTYTVDMGAFTLVADGGREYFNLRGALATVWPATSTSAVARYGCAAVAVGAALLVDRWLTRRRETPRATAAAAALSLWLITALLLAPMSEKHHLALLLPAAALGLFGVAPRREAFAWASAVAVAMLLSKPFPHGAWYFVAVTTSYAWTVRSALLDRRGVEQAPR